MIISFTLINLISRTVFPKVRSADHFWCARFSILVRKKKKTDNTYQKESYLIHQNLYFLVRGTTFNNFAVRQIFFQCFMVHKPKKFGKHCSRKMNQMESFVSLFIHCLCWCMYIIALYISY